MNSDLYTTLGIERSASYDDIRKTYRALVKTHHPDVGGNADYFREIELAHRILTDEPARAEYDRTGFIPNVRAADTPDTEVWNTVTGLLFQAINETHDLDTTDLFVFVRRRIDGLKRDAGRQKSQSEAALKRIEKAKNRITTKAEINILANVLENQCVLTRQQIVKAENNISACDRAFVMLDAYTYETTKRESPLNDWNTKSPIQNLNAMDKLLEELNK